MAANAVADKIISLGKIFFVLPEKYWHFYLLLHTNNRNTRHICLASFQFFREIIIAVVFESSRLRMALVGKILLRALRRAFRDLNSSTADHLARSFRIITLKPLLQ